MCDNNFFSGERVAVKLGYTESGLSLMFATVLGYSRDDENAYVIKPEDGGHRMLVYRWDDGHYRTSGTPRYMEVCHLYEREVRDQMLSDALKNLIEKAEAFLSERDGDAQVADIAATARELKELVA